MHFQSYQILNSNKKTLSFSRNICYNAQVKFNRILTNISNPEERAKEELWGWNPKASAPAGTFKGSVKSLKNKQRLTVVRRRSQKKSHCCGEHNNRSEKAGGSEKYSQENYSNGLFWK